VATCAIELAKIRLAAGDLVAAESQLVSASGAIAAHSHPELWAALSNERGNLAIAMAEPEEAIDHYTRAWQVASRVGDGSLAFRVAVNAAWLAAGNLDPAVAAEWIERARLQGAELEPHHEAAYSWIRHGLASRKLADRSKDLRPAMLLRAYESFTAALEMAEGLDDARARTAALGSLGALYQLQGRLAEAHDLTARALRSAEKMGGREVQMRLYAQAGRIDRARGDRESAIRHLEEATLLAAEGRKSSRSTPRARPRADDAAAVRLELVDLLLRRAAEQPEPALGQADLRRAQQTIERTKANELRDYFRDECVDAYREKTVASSSVSPSAAIVYPLSLPDRMVLLARGAVRGAPCPRRGRYARLRAGRLASHRPDGGAARR
jgi:tetratricopeptide (TPR) repeat protein